MNVFAVALLFVFWVEISTQGRFRSWAEAWVNFLMFAWLAIPPLLALFCNNPTQPNP